MRLKEPKRTNEKVTFSGKATRRWGTSLFCGAPARPSWRRWNGLRLDFERQGKQTYEEEIYEAAFVVGDGSGDGHLHAAHQRYGDGD